MNRNLIRSFVADLLQKKGDPDPFADDDSLLLTGRIDSLNVLEIVEFLQEKVHFEIAETAFDQTRFDSVDSIVALVTSSGEGA